MPATGQLSGADIAQIIVGLCKANERHQVNKSVILLSVFASLLLVLLILVGKAPRESEIVVHMAVSDGLRPHPHVGKDRVTL